MSNLPTIAHPIVSMSVRVFKFLPFLLWDLLGVCLYPRPKRQGLQKIKVKPLLEALLKSSEYDPYKLARKRGSQHKDG